jgi:hypothetical protein
MRHDTGLAASPPVHYKLEVAGSNVVESAAILITP